MKNDRSKTIIFITGAFVGNNSWTNWKQYFEDKGYTVFVPAWPFKDDSPEILRNRHPDADIASLRLTQLVEHYATIAAQLTEEPILIGHSLGGLIVQLLLQKQIGVAGVAIHSVPPQGVISFEWSFIKSVFNPLGFFTSAKKTYLMSFPEWQYAFTNGMPHEEQLTSYDEYVVPESKLVLRDGLTSAAKIDFKKPHAPLLILSGSIDHIMPASLNYSNYRKYKHKGSVTDYMEFEGSNHFVLGQPTWRNEAEFTARWLEENS
ncbi:alpha/beta fold hydrolase [Pedobacter chinensis]|uniref:Alpha/beta fold hydrolase n=1 Tax=Pedobacter chinensis TaxID=2282421 RepID=A0A369Q210_9SPHI|nr:alpha/beta hydrolase [Pedobacter chinensis]RDC56368.1 alpha/beta fold hydrolase [Pedobacter chinensis]